MEPLAIQSTAASALARPVGLQPDLSALLQDGRVLAGQVLKTFGGGSVLLGVGRHRVPAESQVELALGDRLLLQVELRASGRHLLHVLGAGPTEPDLVRALRAAVGEDRPVAQLLSDLAARLRAQSGTGGQSGARADRLLQDLASHVFRPGSDGAELGTLLARSGLRYEAALATAAHTKSGAAANGPGPTVTVRGLASLFAEAWSAGAADPGTAGELERAFARALGEALAGPRAEGAGALTEVVQRLRAALARHARALPAGAARTALEAGLPELNATSLAGRREGGLLARLLGLDAGVDPALLARWSAEATLSELKHDLKALLLRARGALPEGAPAEALARALTGLEAEQLLNLARRESHDAWHWSFPVPDGEAWNTAHLFYRLGHDRDGSGEGGGENEHAHRFVLGIELSRLGPVRAELLLQNDMLGVRILVTEPDVAQRIRADLAELRDRIAAGDRRVHVSVVESTAAEASIEPLRTDIRYLREHPLLDLSG